MSRNKQDQQDGQENSRRDQKDNEPNRFDRDRFDDGYMAALYNWLYWIGISLIRQAKRIQRKVRQKAGAFLSDNLRKRREFHRRVRNTLEESWRVVLAPSQEIPRRLRQMQDELETEKRYGTDWSVFRKRLHMVSFVGKKIWSALRGILNYALPVLGILLLVKTFQDVGNDTYALRLEYNGETLGYIQDESVFKQAQNAVLDRLATDIYLDPLDLTPSITLEKVTDTEYLSVDDLTNVLIAYTGTDLVEAEGFYLETTVYGQSEMELVGALEDGDALLTYLSGLLNAHLEGEDGSARAQFLKKVQVKRGLYPVSALRTLDSVIEELDELEEGEQRYTVVSGDTPIIIAAKNGISLEQLRRLNPEVDTRLLPGDSLLISQQVQKMGVQVTKTIRYEEVMEFRIQQETVPSRDIGWSNLKQQGQKGLQEVIADVVMVDGVEVERSVVSISVLREPVPQILQVGGNRPLQVIPETSAGNLPSGAFAWPASGGRITTSFRGYWGHTGADISWPGCYGTPIYASARGTVVAVNYHTYNYGYHVVIDHGGGIRTLYAHCSSLNVSVGDQVEQGDRIGAIGSTGNSTGPHLHFEIQIGGTAVDPAPYLYGQR